MLNWNRADVQVLGIGRPEDPAFPPLSGLHRRFPPLFPPVRNAWRGAWLASAVKTTSTALADTHSGGTTDTLRSVQAAVRDNVRIRRVDSSGFFSSTIVGKEVHEYGSGRHVGPAYAAEGGQD